MKQKLITTRNISILAVFLLLTLAITHPIFKNINNIGVRDWDAALGQDEILRLTILKYHQIPLWNPYVSGGVPFLGDPLIPALSPFQLINLVFGVLYGNKIQLLLWYLICLYGMYYLCKTLKLSEAACFVGAFTFALSSFFSLHWSVGHVIIVTSASLIPWLFLFYIRALTNRVNIIYCSIVATLMFFVGGGYILVISFMGLFIFALTFSYLNKTYKPLLYLCVIGILLLGLGAIRWLPMIENMLISPRVIEEGDYVGGYQNMLFVGYPTLTQLKYAFVGIPQSKFVTNEQFTNGYWDDYGMYIGYISLILAAIGLYTWHSKGGRLVKISMIIIGIIGIVLSFGTGANVMIVWHALHHLPLFASIRYPTRFALLTLFALSILSAYGMSYLSSKIKNKYIILIICTLVAINLIYVDSSPFNETFTLTPLSSPHPNNTFTQTNSIVKVMRYGNLYESVLNNHGVKNYYASLRQFSSQTTEVLSVYNINHKGEAYSPGTKDVTITYWSPNKIVVSVNSTIDTMVIINQNYYSGWQGSNKSNNVLWASVPAGNSIVEFRYMPTSFIVGALITIISIICLIYYWIKND